MCVHIIGIGLLLIRFPVDHFLPPKPHPHFLHQVLREVWLTTFKVLLLKLGQALYAASFYLPLQESSSTRSTLDCFCVGLPPAATMLTMTFSMSL